MRARLIRRLVAFPRAFFPPVRFCVLLPLAGILHDEGAHDARGQADAAEDGDAEQTFLGDLVVDELAQVGGLEVGGLLVEEQVVVAAGLAVVAELVVAEGEVVEALAAALRGDAEDFGQQLDAELLLAAVRGLDETLWWW